MMDSSGKRKDRAAVRLATKRSAKLSAQRRQDIARRAAVTRWARKRAASQSGPVPSIEEIAAELTRDIPQESWNRLPADLIAQLDHYLYGWPRP